MYIISYSQDLAISMNKVVSFKFDTNDNLALSTVDGRTYYFPYSGIFSPDKKRTILETIAGNDYYILDLDSVLGVSDDK